MNIEQLNENMIQQFSKKHKNYKIIYTLLDNGNEWELWAKAEGYAIMIFLYGGHSKDLPGHTINLDYALDDATLEQLTGEGQEA